MAYLKSPEWAARRAEVLRRAGGTCQRRPAPATEVRHLSYANLGQELPSDLIAVCPACHRAAHG